TFLSEKSRQSSEAGSEALFSRSSQTLSESVALAPTRVFEPHDQSSENAASEDPGWDEDALFALVMRAYPYRNLSRELFDSIVEMLSEGIAARRGRYGAYLHHDRVNRKLRARRAARLAAITSGGAIPETALFTVVAEPEGGIVGTLDEHFAGESNAGDIVLLG